MQVTKVRNRPFREGYHDFLISQRGMEIFPRLVAAEHRSSYAREAIAIASGLPSLDALLGGGLARGTSTLILGAAGTGKSTLATQYASAAAARGDRVCTFLFDESIATLLERSAGLGMELDPHIEAGLMQLRQVDPAELSPGEFSHAVRRAVEGGTRMVVIDSLSGYLNAMPSERFLTLHLHELLTQHGLVGPGLSVGLDASYLADSVLLLRHFEAFGEVRQAISVIKKRTGKHEKTIRELRMDRGVTVGEPLREFQGVLSDSPQFVGKAAGSLREPHATG
jgi:circadian clock protein KaiC